MELTFYAPLSGPIVPLETVPDPVFAQRMAGDGVGIDPITGVLLAPCDGRLTQVHRKRHAVTITTAEGIELLIHIGLDTVDLDGEGFTARVTEGQLVRRGDVLIEFDIDRVALKAKSLVSVVLIANHEAFRPVQIAEGSVEAGITPLFTATGVSTTKETQVRAATATAAELPQIESEPLLVESVHGIHARPAATVAETARRFQSAIHVSGPSGKLADARSVVALLGLEIETGDAIRIQARGADASEAISAVSAAARQAFRRIDHAVHPEPAKAPVGSELPAPLHTFRGISAATGVALGRAVKLSRPVFEVAEHGADPRIERQRLQDAISTARVEIETQIAAGGQSQSEILLAHRILLEDPLLVSEAEESIEHGKSAAWAWRAAAQNCQKRVAGLKSGLLAGRAADIDDVGQRVLAQLAGATLELPALGSDSVILAEDLAPSLLISLDRSNLAGLATVRGGPTSHLAILSRSMGLPAVVGLPPAILELAADTQLVLDGDQGLLETEPTVERIETVRALQKRRQVHRAEVAGEAQLPAITTDGIRIEVAANAGSSSDAQKAVQAGADGIGLLRTEFLFLERAEPPSEEEHYQEYRAILQTMGDRPTIIRTLDLGGDKLPPYFPQLHEDNPNLGVRGVRLAFQNPEIYQAQIRAILRLSDTTLVRIMLPLVSNVEEVRKLREMIVVAGKAVGATRFPEIGIMVETPAAAIQSDRFAAVADFFSIGSNDLTQYILAIDRGHPILGRDLDSLHPAVLRAISVTVEGASHHKRWVGVCGAMASEPLAVPLLIGLGVTELSVSVPMVAEIKARVRALDLAKCRTVAGQALELDTPADVRTLLAKTFKDDFSR
jgi:multiphosphoryl transfer protein